MSTIPLAPIPLNSTPTVLPARLPQVLGDGRDRRRKYTVAELPFDAFEAAGHRRPATAPAGLLFVQYHPGPDGTYVHVGLAGDAHEMDGRKFPTITDAERALYEARVLAFLVHEEDAAGLGLPVGLQWAAHKTPAGTGCRWSHTAAPAWLADTVTPAHMGAEPVTADDRLCPAECPGSTVEPVTLDPSAWARCERCRQVFRVEDLDEDSGLCELDEQYNTDRVSL